jgi:Transposase and inactivated derivatives
MSAWRLFYHIVWYTEESTSLLEGEVKGIAFGAIQRRAYELGVTVHALGGTSNHLHLVLTIPPQLAVGDCIQELKRASRQAVNQRLGLLTRLRWQREYGVFTFGERSLPSVVDYVLRQEAIHRGGELKRYYEQVDDGS